jgi:hypothetical protein
MRLFFLRRGRIVVVLHCPCATETMLFSRNVASEQVGLGPVDCDEDAVTTCRTCMLDTADRENQWAGNLLLKHMLR